MPIFAKRDYTLELVTPAFLGGAEDQSAEWRTPALKALIRQWWRVVWYAENTKKTPSEQLSDMQLAEALRFGSVEKGKNGKARIQIRFDEEAKNPTGFVSGIRNDQNQSLQYLGFGPFVQPTNPSSKKALNIGAKVKFKVLIQGTNQQETETFTKELDKTMFLLQQFGTLGSRANNAWGSLHISGDIQPTSLTSYSLSLSQCLTNDWKKAITKDNKGLMIWRTNPFNNSDDAMKRLKTFRKEGHNSLAKQMGKRPLVNAPVKGNQNRYPSQFVLKVLKEGNQYRGQVTLLAHKWHNDTRDLTAIITTIATYLDDHQDFERIKG
jgi:CRISPR-associated protein Cmr1